MATSGERLPLPYRPTLVYAREDAELHTRICAYNYFSELMPGPEVAALLSVRLYDRAGAEVAAAERHLPHRGQLQLELGSVVSGFEGTAGVVLRPEPLPELPPDRWYASGFYVRYRDAQGHLDMGHEWEPATPRPAKEKSYIQFVTPKSLASTEIIAINPYAGDEDEAGACRWRLRLRDAAGAVLAERAMPDLPPRGSGRFDLAEVFADWEAAFAARDTLGLEAVGRNLAGPLSLLRHRNGDFSLHHF